MLRNLPSDSNMCKALLMGIALASNIGGMLSPIASPQNVVAMGIMVPEPGWGQWFFIVIPVGIISIVLIWILLLVTFRPGRGTTIVPIREHKEQFTGVQWFVTIVTIATIALWCASHQLEGVFGDMGVIAIIPIVLFFGVGILTKEDFNNFPWTIIILAAGGLSLGKAVKSSGLLDTVAIAISHRVDGMSLYGVLVVFSCLILVIATFISHTVAALIILPLVYDVGASMEEPHPNLLVMAGVLMCSAAMALPTSGFPNMSECLPNRSFCYVDRPLIKHLLRSCYNERGRHGPEISPGEALHQQGRAEQSYHACRGSDAWIRGDESEWHVSVLVCAGPSRRLFSYGFTNAAFLVCGAAEMNGIETAHGLSLNIRLLVAYINSDVAFGMDIIASIECEHALKSIPGDGFKIDVSFEDNSSKMKGATLNCFGCSRGRPIGRTRSMQVD